MKKKLLFVPLAALLMVFASAGTLYVQKVILQRMFVSELASTVLQQGELVYVEDGDYIAVGDGSTAGGTAMLTAEADTLATVVARGSTATNVVTLGGVAVSVGGTATASGSSSAAIGEGSSATGSSSLAIAAGKAIGPFSFGIAGTASNLFSIAIGPNSSVVHDYSIVFSADEVSEAGGNQSTASEEITLVAPGGIRLIGAVTGPSSITTTGAVLAATFRFSNSTNCYLSTDGTNVLFTVE